MKVYYISWGRSRRSPWADLLGNAALYSKTGEGLGLSANERHELLNSSLSRALNAPLFRSHSIILLGDDAGSSFSEIIPMLFAIFDVTIPLNFSFSKFLLDCLNGLFCRNHSPAPQVSNWYLFSFSPHQAQLRQMRGKFATAAAVDQFQIKIRQRGSCFHMPFGYIGVFLLTSR